jgi:hypothetical protein
MRQTFQQASLKGLWISAIALLILMTVQGFSGNWITIFLRWPGTPNLSDQFIQAMIGLSSYHSFMGLAIGCISVLNLVLAFMSRSSIYVRILAVLGLVIMGSAAMGGILYVSSGYQDRWSLGQMMDSFVGVYADYFLQLFFINRTPRFPWTKGV